MNRRATMQRYTTDERLPPIFSLPSELFSNITRYLTKRDLWQLLYTCASLRASPLMLMALYTQPISSTDIPLSYHDYCKRRRVLAPMTDACRPEYLRYCNSIMDRPEFKAINGSLNEKNGQLVKNLVFSNPRDYTLLETYSKYSKNIESFDFFNFVYPIDYKPDPLMNPQGIDGVNWEYILIKYPSMFKTLKSIKLNYRGFGVRDYGWLNVATQLPELLDLSVQLQSLELSLYFPESEKPRHPEASARLQNQIIFHASPELRSLTLLRMHPITLNIASFLQPLEALPALTHIIISFDFDLLRIEKDLQFQPVPRRKMHGVASPWDYIQALKAAAETRRWKISFSENDPRCCIGPRSFYAELDDPGLVSSHFQWLFKGYNWTPTFHWTYQMWKDSDDFPMAEEFGLHTEDLDRLIEDGPLHLMTPEERDLELYQCRRLFQEMKSIDMPVKLHLKAKEDVGAFFVRNFIMPETRRTEEELPPDYTRYDRDDWPNSKPFTLDGSNAIWPKFYQHGEALFQQHQKENLTSHDWYLSHFGDLVDHLSISWTDLFLCRLKESFQYKWLTRRDSRPFQMRYRDELHRIAPLFATLAQDFPNLLRLELHIQKDFYADLLCEELSASREADSLDRDFILKILPGYGWTVRRDNGKDSAVEDMIKVQHGGIQLITIVFSRPEVTM